MGLGLCCSASTPPTRPLPLLEHRAHLDESLENLGFLRMRLGTQQGR